MKKKEEILSIVSEPAARYQKAHEGISKLDFLDIVAMTGMNLTEFSEFLPVSKRTLEKIKEEELISATVSDRVLQIAALFQHGAEVLGNMDAFKSWLQTELLSLANKRPMDFMDNGTGLSIIHDLLGRIEHGVYS
ncbi:MAG: antitoxin Xre/MbcA/ParS toxin-binding domain-containing protein [Reichenbachiella sp.]|uniref:type II RES/Xre toxin-antitoxin system antitoxin n=1 Tax=Reichenbachiella sp. TaxID=2184521 RepID=UPI003266124A